MSDAAERSRIERELGIALDDVDAAAVRRAKSRGAAWDELVEEVLVHETWFFRDPGAFEVLGSLARQRGALRVLSAPCSTGEEAYSCAIALRESGVPLAACTIVGVDVSEKALARARLGRYGPPAFRSTHTGWEDGAFEPTSTSERTLSSTLREAVRFRAANLVDDGALEDEAPFDVIFCRNLVVYLTPTARARIARVLARLLAPGGVLFLGHAEELPGFERWGPARALSFRAASGILRAPRPGIPRLAATPPATVRATVNAVVNATATTTPAAMPARSALETARALADRGLVDEALAHAERAARDATSLAASAEAYALLGTIESALGHPDQAVRAWQRAVYCDPSHEAATVSLATALRARGETARADALLRALAQRGGTR